MVAVRLAEVKPIHDVAYVQPKSSADGSNHARGKPRIAAEVDGAQRQAASKARAESKIRIRGLLGAAIEDLPRDAEACAADIGISSRYSLSIGSAFATEGAPSLRVAGGQSEARPSRRTIQGRFRAVNAFIANVDVGTSEKFAQFAGRPVAECADHVAPRVSRLPNPAPPRPTGALNYLLDSLMADAKCLGDLP